MLSALHPTPAGSGRPGRIVWREPAAYTDAPMGLQRAVFFDFDETLVHADPPAFETFLTACAQLDLRFSEEQIRRGKRFLYAYFSGSQSQGDYAHFGSDPDRFYVHVTERLLREMGLDGGAAETAARVESVSVKLPKDLKAPPASYDVLEALKARGLTLGVISNNGDDIAARARAFGFDAFLDFVITRRDAGCSKPDPGIFELGLARAGLPAEAVAFVGDNYYADVLGSAAAGMTPVLVDPEGLFPEAACDVISRIDELPPLVG